jgi:SAM-dependent methyltransferase
MLQARGIHPPSRLLDAGCGTGRYTAALARSGFEVTGVDRSEDLIAVARHQFGEMTGRPKFDVADLTRFRCPAGFDAVLCRGVLNDILADEEREAIAKCFADHVRPHGAVILDVRDWTKTASRYRDQATWKRRVNLPDGRELLFESRSELVPEQQELQIDELFEVRWPKTGEIERSTNKFRMRCWSADELHRLFGFWFDAVDIAPDYFEPAKWNDRLVFVGSRKGT